MRVPNEPGDGNLGAFSELLRLQTEFQTRLAEETLRYLRRLQGASAPATPGTVLMPGSMVELQAAGRPGETVELTLEVENRQRAHSVVTPMLSPMASAAGATWFPAADPSPASMLLAPEEVATLTIRLALPDNLPVGAYRGALLLQGFREGAIAVVINVRSSSAPKPKAGAQAPSMTKKSETKKSETKKSETKKSETKKSETKKSETKKSAKHKAAKAKGERSKSRRRK
ncbi:MAG: hypothetical protein MOB07_17950 [Acidobacteria bacterium]|nr:hypothetical protein [Acidobacteriota bacterium]